MKEIVTDYFVFTLKDNVIYIDYLVPEITEKMVDMGIQKRLELADKKTYPIISDIRKVKNFTRDARNRLAREDAASYCGKTAVVVNSNVQKVFFNFFNEVFKVPAPTKLFTKIEDAELWVKE